MIPLTISSPCNAGAVEPLGKAALFFKGFGQGGDLTVQKSAGHVDEHQRGIGGKLRINGRSGRSRRSGSVVSLRRSTLSTPSARSTVLSTTQSTPITNLPNPNRHLVGTLKSPVHQLLAERFVATPLRQPPLPQKILIVEPKLRQAGPGLFLILRNSPFTQQRHSVPDQAHPFREVFEIFLGNFEPGLVARMRIGFFQEVKAMTLRFSCTGKDIYKNTIGLLSRYNEYP